MLEAGLKEVQLPAGLSVFHGRNINIRIIYIKWIWRGVLFVIFSFFFEMCFLDSAFAFLLLLLLLLFCFCCFYAFVFLSFCSWLLLLFCLGSCSPFTFCFSICLLSNLWIWCAGIWCAAGEGAALPPPNPAPRHEICTSSPTPAPATKSKF